MNWLKKKIHRLKWRILSPPYGSSAVRISIIVTFFLNSGISLAAADGPDAWIDPDGIDGQLMICGGGQLSEKILGEFVRRAGGTDARLVVIPTASSRADNAEPEFWLKPWTEFGLASLKVLHTRSRDVAQEQTFSSVLEDATAVWLPGGSQSLLSEAYVDTRVQKRLRALLERGGIIGGTSAGAAIMSRTMIASGSPRPVIKTGLGLLPGVIIDQHFSERARQPRLEYAVERHPALAGMGIDEGTAVLVEGRRIQVLGSRSVTVRWGESPVHEAESIVLNAGDLADLTAIRRTALDRLRHDSFPAFRVGVPNVTRGSLVIVGGGRMPKDIVEEFLRLAGGEKARIVVLPTAVEDKIARLQGVPSFIDPDSVAEVSVLPQRTRAEVESDEFLDALKNATGIWFGGGRQWRFVDAYADTKAIRELDAVLSRGGVIGGSSAGASIQGSYLARGNPLGNREIMARGYERGFGFLEGVAIDQHFTQRRRADDLRSLVNTYPRLLGVGIDEATALIVQGSRARVVGKNAVFFMTADAADMTIRLSDGEEFDLRQRKSIQP